MKRFLFLLSIVMCLFSGKAQTVQTQPLMATSAETQLKSLSNRIDTLYMMENARLNNLEINTSLKYRYKMYPTENMYTFLKLDTKTGKIWKVQWGLGSVDEFSVSINTMDLSFDMGYGSNSFELYSTQNMYQFILLDKTDGRTWHVQWGMKETDRWIRRIF